jgi:hypothetical protein
VFISYVFPSCTLKLCVTVSIRSTEGKPCNERTARSAELAWSWIQGSSGFTPGLPFSHGQITIGVCGLNTEITGPCWRLWTSNIKLSGGMARSTGRRR